MSCKFKVITINEAINHMTTLKRNYAESSCIKSKDCFKRFQMKETTFRYVFLCLSLGSLSNVLKLWHVKCVFTHSATDITWKNMKENSSLQRYISILIETLSINHRNILQSKLVRPPPCPVCDPQVGIPRLWFFSQLAQKEESIGYDVVCMWARFSPYRRLQSIQQKMWPTSSQEVLRVFSKMCDSAI